VVADLISHLDDYCVTATGALVVGVCLDQLKASDTETIGEFLFGRARRPSVSLSWV
jgi:hypothetical protein